MLWPVSKDRLRRIPPHGKPPQRAESSNELVVLASVNANCRRSTNEMARETGLSQSTVHRILRKHKYHPLKFRQHQELRPGDNERRMEFGMLVLERIDNDPYFVRNILFTDESSFNLHHGPNPQNVRHWAQVNSNVTYASHTQHPSKLNLWAGIVNEHLIGPIIIDGTLTSDKYFELMVTEIGPRITDFGLNDDLFYLHDGYPAHNYRPGVAFLRESFPRRVIGTYEEPLSWPARSPDLNIMNFFFVGSPHVYNLSGSSFSKRRLSPDCNWSVHRWNHSPSTCSCPNRILRPFKLLRSRRRKFIRTYVFALISLRGISSLVIPVIVLFFVLLFKNYITAFVSFLRFCVSFRNSYTIRF